MANKTNIFRESFDELNTTQVEVSMANNVITIPTVIIEMLDIEKGDKFFCYADGNTIILTTRLIHHTLMGREVVPFRTNHTFIIPEQYRNILNKYRVFMHIERGDIHITSKEIWKIEI